MRFVDLLNNRVVVQGSQTIGQRWQRWKKQAGLPRGLRLHDLRRDCAHRVYAASGDVRQVQGLLGHESPVTSLRYLHMAAPVVEPSSVAAALLREGA